MANINISGLSDAEKEEYTSRAKQSGATSRSEWIRWRLRTGVKRWDATGSFDQELLDRPFSEDKIVSEKHESTSITPKMQIKDVIENNLSTTEPSSFDELINLIVEGLVSDALYELQQEGRVENIPGKGYTKTWKND